MGARLALAVFAVLGATLGGGCDDLPAADTPDDRPEASLARSLCEASCARAIRCEGPRATSCDCGTVRDLDLLRPDWTQAQIACLGRTPCGGAEVAQDCETEAYRAIGAAPVSWPTAVMRCIERGETCGGSGATCRRLAAMTDDVRTRASVCFDQPCDAYAACFQEFLASQVTPAVPAWR